ncbi:hypothetical protein OC846_004194 [Tilletia horrida]|uniref:Uncharacterized protein n=1 Tax=Tilletia horrida TaxID=155126 RepID=A0AAN6GP57_9BASI|nr:hypothetical protein OC845_004706 [Tilletia horrida]KAK0549174.1 hypothetical protein OC846_004194 [Tilletia horrida]KAK0564507.1 hypothetical protein OC861_004252 [Tilletia horrida]
MRFAPIAIATVAAFGFAAAAPLPAPAAPNGLLQELGSIVAGLESALGITKIEDDLYSFLKLNAVDDLAGITKLEESLKLTNKKSHKGVLQALGNVVSSLEKKLGITKIDDALSKKLGLTELEKILGITKLEKVGLGL